MTDKPKLSIEQAHAALKKEVEDDRFLQETEEMTEAELDEALAKEGITPDKLAAMQAKDRERTAPLTKAQPEKSNVVSLDRWRIVRWAAGSSFIAAAASVLLLLGGIKATDHSIVSNAEIPTTSPIPTTAPQSLDLTSPRFKRYDALAYCAAHEYDKCLELLRQADKDDPHGRNELPQIAPAIRYATEATTHDP